MLQDNLIKFFEESFKEHSDAPAITDYFTSEVFTYYTLAQEVAKLHMLFDACGLKEDDKVAVVGRNNPRWAAVCIATLTYGSTVVPIMQDFDANDINHIIAHSHARLLFLSDIFWDIVEPDSARRVKAAFSLSDFRCLYERDGEKLTAFQRDILRHFNARYPKGFLPADISYEAPALKHVAAICYTSGTTGFSKGVMLTVGNLTANVSYTLSRKLFGRGVRTLGMLPLGHIYGFVLDMLAPLAAGSHITLLGHIPSAKVLNKELQGVHPHVVCTVPRILEQLTRKEVLERMQTGAVRLASLVPAMNSLIEPAARKILTHAFGGEIRLVIVGGAPLNREIEHFLLRIRFPFTVGYGMTECGPLISHSAPEEFAAGSCGRIVSRMEVRIASSDAAKIPGEILVRGDHVMAGYFRDKRSTACAIDREEWLHTGDMGTLEGDVLRVRGRLESRITLPDGREVYPEEIESRLNVMDGIMESLVAMHEGRLVAFVVPDYEQADHLGIGMNGIREMIDANLAALNASLGDAPHIEAIILYPSEFEKTPKMSIRRYLYVK